MGCHVEQAEAAAIQTVDSCQLRVWSVVLEDGGHTFSVSAIARQCWYLLSQKLTVLLRLDGHN